MEWLDKLNKSIEYIEDNLDGEINYEEAAKLQLLSLPKDVFLYSWCDFIGIYKKQKND